MSAPADGQKATKEVEIDLETPCKAFESRYLKSHTETRVAMGVVQTFLRGCVLEYCIAAKIACITSGLP